VTDNGKPSGIATTTTVTPIMKNPINSFQCLLLSHFTISSEDLSTANLILNTIRINNADHNPKYPISLAICSSFYCNGVHSGSA